jgi:maleate isomerase
MYQDKEPARIGVLVPAADSTVEADFQRFLPKEVTFHTNRLPQTYNSETGRPDLLELMCEAAPAAALQLALVSPKLLVFACSSASFFKGARWPQELADKLEAAAGIPTVTTAGALIEAINILGATNLFIVSPYPDEMNRRIQEFLVAHDKEIKTVARITCEFSRDLTKITPSAIRDAVGTNRSKLAGCDAIVIPGTALRAMEIANSIEETFGLPVVTSNSAKVWTILKRLEMDPGSVRAGRLFQH